MAAIAIASSVPASANDFESAEMMQGVTEALATADKESLYEAGSIGKIACTIAALRFADRGQLSLDQTLGETLPALADTPVAAVNLRELLANRSGLADGLLPAFGRSPREVMSTPDAKTAVLRYASGELAAEPDTVFSYDLVNWIAVQAMLEAVTGKGIAQVLEEEVILPAGMVNSRVFVGTIGEDAAPPAVEGRPIPAFLTCAGGLATRPADLLALARFPHAGGLDEEGLAALVTITTPEEDYTLGGRYLIDAQTSHAISWQSGSNGAYKSLVVYDPQSDRGFAAMTASNDAGQIQAGRSKWMEDAGL